MPITAGYLLTPLAKKPEIKTACVVRLHAALDYYFSLSSDWPQDVVLNKIAKALKKTLSIQR